MGGEPSATPAPDGTQPDDEQRAIVASQPKGEGTGISGGIPADGTVSEDLTLALISHAYGREPPFFVKRLAALRAGMPPAAPTLLPDVESTGVNHHSGPRSDSEIRPPLPVIDDELYGPLQGENTGRRPPFVQVVIAAAAVVACIYAFYLSVSGQAERLQQESAAAAEAARRRNEAAKPMVNSPTIAPPTVAPSAVNGAMPKPAP